MPRHRAFPNELPGRFSPQEMKNGVGNGANAQLNGSHRPQSGWHSAVQCALQSLPQGEWDGGEGLITFYGQVNVIDMDQSVTVCPGHVTIDLCDDQFGTFGDALRIVHRHAIGTVPRSSGGERVIKATSMGRNPS